MEKDVLKTILESDAEYFIVQNIWQWSDWRGHNRDVKIMLISFPDSLNKIRAEKTYDDITVKEMELFERTYIDKNIFLFPKYSPFQHGQDLRNAVSIFPLSGDWDISDFLAINSDHLYEYQKIHTNLKPSI
jgi:hypothetical protein